MVAQSEQAFLAMAHEKAPKGATVKMEYEDMEAFFIKSGREP
jgi:hypothetical protein